MKYKIKQSKHIDLEDDLNRWFEEGYTYKCKIFEWVAPGEHQKTLTYLIEKS